MPNKYGALYIVDDDPLARESIAALMQSMGLHTREFASAEEFLESLSPDTAGCVICDHRMPGLSGVELLERLRQMGCPLPFVLITAYADVNLAVRAMRLGAVTLLEKPYRDNDLWEVVRGAIDVELQNRDRWRRLHRARRQLAELSPEDRQLLDSILAGHVNKQTAQQLTVSVRTVESRRHALYQRLGVSSLVELVRLVVESEQAEMLTSLR